MGDVPTGLSPRAEGRRVSTQHLESSFKLELVSNPGVCFPPGPRGCVCWSWSCVLPVLCGSSRPCPVSPSPCALPRGCLSPQPALSSPSTRSLPGLQVALPVHCRLGLWRVSVSVLLSPPLPLVYSLGFFSLNSIAYRRVIRVYQYEVGDDLSGRFFSSYFSSYLTVVLPMHSTSQAAPLSD